MNPKLRANLIKSAVGGALAIAAVMGVWYEGSGPTITQPDGTILYIPYRDTGGVWTVCHGVTGSIIPTRRYTETECAAMEKRHYAAAERGAKSVLAHYDEYSVWRRAALIDYTYNLGIGNLASSTMARKFNAGDDIGGCNELLKWVKGRVKGRLVTLNGLVDRRSTERELCLEDLN